MCLTRCTYSTIKLQKNYLSAFIFIYQTGSNINNYNNEKLNDKYLIRYYKLLQNWMENHSL